MVHILCAYLERLVTRGESKTNKIKIINNTTKFVSFILQFCSKEVPTGFPFR
jgi:hypothetical protein